MQFHVVKRNSLASQYQFAFSLNSFHLFSVLLCFSRPFQWQCIRYIKLECAQTHTHTQIHENHNIIELNENISCEKAQIFQMCRWLHCWYFSLSTNLRLLCLLSSSVLILSLETWNSWPRFFVIYFYHSIHLISMSYGSYTMFRIPFIITGLEEEKMLHPIIFFRLSNPLFCMHECFYPVFI